MVTSGDNTERLVSAGVIPGPPPEPYDRVVESLTTEEVDALIAAKKGLDRTTSQVGVSPAEIGFFVPL